ncbi:MAG: hypothetical protein AAF629_00320 [Chloroflexota bacterium]
MSRAEAKPKHYRATTYLSWIEDEALISYLQASDNEASTLRYLVRLGLQAANMTLTDPNPQPVSSQTQTILEQILANTNPDLLRQVITAVFIETLSQVEINAIANAPLPTQQPEDNQAEASLDALLL